MRPPHGGRWPRGGATSSSSPRCAGSCRCAARTRRPPDGRVTSVVRQWDRRHWGEGGDEFHWWCTEDPEAFVGHEPVYVSMRTELETMAGKKIYKRLAAYLDERTRTADPGDPAAPPDPPPLSRVAEPSDRPPPGYSASGSSSAKAASSGRCRGSRRSRPRWPGTTRRACRRARRRIRGSADWPLRPIASGCALLRSGDGVPSSRKQLLAPPGVARTPITR